jgi:outer membrane protein assembly factor BamA
VSPFQIEPVADGDSCTVIYNVKELPSTSFDGAGGFITLRNHSNFVGRIRLDFGDILGTGRAFGFLWNKKDRFSSEINLHYFEPYIFNSRFDMQLEAFQNDRDTAYVQTGGNVGFRHSFEDRLIGSLWLTLQRTEPEPHSNVVSSIGRTAKIEFVYDNTDYPESQITFK